MTTASPALDRALVVSDPPSEHRVRVRYGRPARWAVRGASLVTAVLLWQLLTTAHGLMWLRFGTVPKPTEVATEFWQSAADRAVLPRPHRQRWAGSSSGSASLGRWAAWPASPWGAPGGRGPAQPILEVVRPIPAIALVPVAILLFPSDESGIVFITFTASLFPVLVSTRHAVRAMPTIVGGGRADSRRQPPPVLVDVVLPGAFRASSAGCRWGWASPGSA